VGSLREYETVFVLHPNTDDARLEEEIEGIRQTVHAGAGEIVDVERWGRRKLAYVIKKVNEGIYTLIRFRSEPSVIAELERRYRLREDILRHLTVLSEGPPSEPPHRRGADSVSASSEQKEDADQGELEDETDGALETTPGSGASALSEADTDLDR